MPPVKEKPALRLYIWRGVLNDYTEGIAFAIARTRKAAFTALGAEGLAAGELDALREREPEVIPLNTFTPNRAWWLHGGG